MKVRRVHKASLNKEREKKNIVRYRNEREKEKESEIAGLKKEAAALEQEGNAGGRSPHDVPLLPQPATTTTTTTTTTPPPSTPLIKNNSILLKTFFYKRRSITKTQIE